ncbi:MAG: aminotransferase class V-fold PLP-dependent enzyme, partial [Proteobacteria bacterium]|nr:aminotransferase class V-fold PLP-dependent enzyme [Pseudomonadota bacterium]
VASLFGVTDSSRLIFTSGATESLNLAIKGLVKPGDHVIASVLEHNSVMRPLGSLGKEGVEVSQIKCNNEGLIDPADVKKTIQGNTALVILTHASNVMGSIEPVQAIGSITRNNNIPLLVDASQTAGVIPLDVEKLNIDMLAASGHKGLMGPQGTGILYVGEGITLKPLKEGGTGGGSSEDEQPEALPDRYEAGTMNTPGIAGLGAAVSFIQERGIDNIRKKELSLLQRLIDGLKQISGVVIYGPHDAKKRVSLVSFNVKELDPAMVCIALDEDYGIMSRSGLHCAPDAHRFLGIFPSGCVRISPGYFNGEDEINRLVNAIQEIAGS